MLAKFCVSHKQSTLHTVNWSGHEHHPRPRRRPSRVPRPAGRSGSPSPCSPCPCCSSRWTSRCSTSPFRSSAATCTRSATQQLWIFDIYGFVLAGLLITMGSLGDRIGRRRLLHPRRSRVRAGVGRGGVRAEPGAAHRRPSATRCRRSHPDAVDARPDPQHVPRRRAAGEGGRGVERGHARRRLVSARSCPGSCSSTSGGARCS